MLPTWVTNPKTATVSWQKQDGAWVAHGWRIAPVGTSPHRPWRVFQPSGEMMVGNAGRVRVFATAKAARDAAIAHPDFPLEWQ
jgi:hypothetical protein